MRNLAATVASLFLVWSLAGCATMSKDQCSIADWHAVGVTDGQDGKSADRFRRHTKACTRHAVAPDHTRYMQGRAQGLLSFCTMPRGYREGSGGKSYDDVCPAQTAAEFLRGYQLGKSEYAARKQLDEVRSDASDLRKKLSEGKLPDNKKYELRRSLRRLKREEFRLEEEIRVIGIQAEAMLHNEAVRRR